MKKKHYVKYFFSYSKIDGIKFYTCGLKQTEQVKINTLI